MYNEMVPKPDFFTERKRFLMKKFISLLLCVLMVMSLAACSKKVDEPKADEPAAKLKVALCVAGSLGDQGFYDSANDGLQKLVAEYGVIPSVVECKGDASVFQPSLVNAAMNNDIVIAVGWEFWDGLTEVVPQMPNTKFIYIDNGLQIEGCNNLLSITYKENQASFLAGYIAMKLSPNSTVGVIGGEDSDTINNFIVGYKQGALYANPEGTVLDPLYANTYEDPAVGKDYALNLYGKGADVIFQVADLTGMGVFEAGAEQGKFAIGVDKDQKYVNPDVIVCSMLKKVGDSIYMAISDFITKGEFAGGTIWDADMTTGLVDIGYGDPSMTQQVSDELKAEVEDLKQKIISGEIVVDSTR